MRAVNDDQVLLQAHCGVSTEYPENVMAAFRAACDLIELDPTFTKDGACVAPHDRTVNRTGRRAAGNRRDDARRGASGGDCAAGGWTPADRLDAL